MDRQITIAPVRKTVVVQAPRAQAFDVFTTGIDRWWPKTHGIAGTPILKSVVEPFVGGRWYTTHADGVEVVVGHVLEWVPAERLVVSWAVTSAWKPEPRVAFASEVEVRFVDEGAGRTRVELEHRNFERMGAVPGEIMRNAVDGGWIAILDLYAQATAHCPT